MLESTNDLARRRESLIFDEVTDLMKHESLLVGRYRAPSSSRRQVRQAAAVTQGEIMLSYFGNITLKIRDAKEKGGPVVRTFVVSEDFF